MTAMQAAFSKAGIQKCDFVFGMQALAYLRSGGTVDGAIAIVKNAAEQLKAEKTVRRGHIPDAETPAISVPSRTAVSAKGDLAAHGPVAEKPNDQLAARSPPSRSRLAAEAKTARRAAVTIMQTLIIDGIPIGRWSVGAAEGVGKKMTREGTILRYAADEARRFGARSDQEIAEILDDTMMQRIVQRADEAAYAAA